MRIALAGNPNSGKTTLYNALTGKNEHSGNWAGVTVDKKQANIKKTFCQGNDIVAVDLPGAYSMSPFTSEESVTSTFIKSANPEAIINIVDATNLSRSLFFTTQLLELGIPMVVALNKTDLNKKKKTKINIEELSKALNCPVVETISTSSKGMEDLMKKVVEVIGTEQKIPFVQKDIDLTSKKEVQSEDRRRFDFVKTIVKKTERRAVKSNQSNAQDKLDKVLAHKWLGIPFFIVAMWAVFSISQEYLGPFIAGYLVDGIDAFGKWASIQVQDASPFLQSLLVDGIIGGVGAVVSFLPLVMVMYFLIALLEDCGYMARVAVVMDRFFKNVGLSGKSIIPMVIGTGCAIPGVMASRTIRNERERCATAMLTPFMPCGAKLPIIALFAGVFFSDASWVGTTMYFAGILFIILGALLVKAITHTSTKNYFIMELPEYKVPSLKVATLSMLDRAKDFIIKAGTVILVCNAIVNIMQSFNWSLELVEEGMESTSILASIASPFAVLLLPLGFGIWQLAAAAITGFIAKENVVGTLAVVFVGLTQYINVDELTLEGGANEVATAMGLTTASALAYLMFNLFTPPCFAAIGAMNAEIKSKKWLLGGLALQFGTGYTVAFIVYQVGTLIMTGSLGDAFIGGLIAVLAMASIVVFLIKKGDKKATAK